MKKCLSIVLIILLHYTIYSQNTPFKCIKTTYPPSKAFKIESYNENDNILECIGIRPTGDTIDWCKYEYNDSGVLLREYSISVLSRMESFDYRYILDSNNNRIARIDNLKNHLDTIPIDSIPIEDRVNEYGDPIYNWRDGYLNYDYDSLHRKVKEVGVKDGDTTTIGYYSYNTIDILARYEDFNVDGELVRTFKYEYDSNENKTRSLHLDSNGDEILEIIYHYDSEGNLSSINGIEFASFDPRYFEEKYEFLPCSY
jgi:hypothetical protein